MSSPSPAEALASIAGHLREVRAEYALVGGMALGVRAEARATKDVDVAIAVNDDDGVEGLIRRLHALGYRVKALLEQDKTGRIATVRLLSQSGMILDVIAASCGIEAEVVGRAEVVMYGASTEIPVARAEELLAMKTLSMSERRLQDRVDAMRLIELNPDLDLEAVRDNLRLIEERGFARDEDLQAKLDSVLAVVRP